MRRRAFLSASLATASLGAGGRARAAAPSIGGALAPDHPLQASWAAWKDLCLAPEGRVVDAAQGDASHSEGQGYGLTLAAAFGDAAAFEAIRVWTETNLAIRRDGLFGWRWRPGDLPRVADPNNASDGDLFFAWGLAAGARSFARPDLVTRAGAICAALAETCIVPSPAGGLVLLPGADGFRTEDGIVLNPSYYMPRAMRELAAETGVTALADCARDGRALMAAIAATGLVPDWIEVTAQGWRAPPGRFSFRAGYEAIRIPLFAVWSGEATDPRAGRYARAIAGEGPAAGAVTVFDRDGTARERSPDPGYRAVGALLSCVEAGTAGAAMPAFTSAQPYYPATLHLMALVAQTEFYPRCAPI